MRVFWFTIKNSDAWAITDKEIIVIAPNKITAKKMLIAKGYEFNKDTEFTELKGGVHTIQEEMTE